MKDAKGYFALINDHYRELLAKEVILAYDGSVTHQVMKAFISLVEEKLESEGEKESVQRKVYHVLVECLQNINRHAETFHPEHTEYYPGRGALLVSKTDAYYRVITANMVNKEMIPELDTFLKTINPLPLKDLNEMYKTQLVDGKLSAKGGAGLGFIDIRRKTANKMEYKFIKHSDNNSYFLFNVIISR